MQNWINFQLPSTDLITPWSYHQTAWLPGRPLPGASINVLANSREVNCWICRRITKLVYKMQDVSLLANSCMSQTEYCLINLWGSQWGVFLFFSVYSVLCIEHLISYTEMLLVVCYCHFEIPGCWWPCTERNSAVRLTEVLPLLILNCDWDRRCSCSEQSLLYHLSKITWPLI